MTVLAERFRRPELVGLRRPRLAERLTNGGTTGLGLVVAPPGSGKTTLLAQVAAVSSIKTVWCRMTPDDRDERVFVSHLGCVLGLVGAPVFGRNDVGSLLSAMEQEADRPVLLVLDDVHELTGCPAEQVLEKLVALRPSWLRLLVGSRRDPDINVPRLRLAGQITEVTGDDLRFRFWEVEDLFSGFFGEVLSPESSAALTRRTGGWAAALQMFHIATSGKSRAERERAVAELGGRSKLIRSYLARNALAGLSRDRREFLVRTCTLESMTGAVCDALLGTTGTGKILRELEEQQLFTTSDESGEVFRYHEVLRTHLERALFEELGIAGARDWFRHSGALLEAIGDTRAAARVYARGEDWASFARLIRAGHGTIIGDDPGREPVIPSGVGPNDPWLALAVARHHLREGKVADAVEGYRRAEQLVDEPSFRELCHGELGAVQAWLPGDAAVGSGVTSAWSVQLRAATRSAPGQVTRELATGSAPADRLVAGLEALLAGRVAAGVAELRSVAHDATADMALRLLGRSAMAVLDALVGTGDACSADLEELACTADMEELPWLGRVVRGVHIAVLAASGEERRIEGCRRIATACEAAGDPWGAALLHLVAAVAADRVAHPTTDSELELAGAAFRFLDAPVLEAWTTAVGVLRQARQKTGQAAVNARRLCENARQLGVPGVEAMAHLALAEADPDGGVELAEARRIAADCGLVLPTMAVPAGIAAPNEVQPAEPHHTPATAVGANAVGLRIQCFGGFTLAMNGCEVPLSALRPRARSLLRMLSFHFGRDVHREVLIDALWPVANLTTGLRRLQVAVSSVRQFLQMHSDGAVEVLRNGDKYRLSSSGQADVDVCAFDTALHEARRADAAGHPRRATEARQFALDVYRGDLLPEEGPADHLIEERDRLRFTAAEVATALAHSYRLQGRSRSAEAAARRSVQLNPLQDQAWEILVDLHESAGDRSAAHAARLEQAHAHGALHSDDTAVSVGHLQPQRDSGHRSPTPRSIGGSRTASPDPPAGHPPMITVGQPGPGVIGMPCKLRSPTLAAGNPPISTEALPI